jgi:sec-independent protein translocase protein TatA
MQAPEGAREAMGFLELFVIFAIVLLFFGAGRLPAVGEGLGKAIRGFKDAMRSDPASPRDVKKDLPPGDGPGA